MNQVPHTWLTVSQSSSGYLFFFFFGWGWGWVRWEGGPGGEQRLQYSITFHSSYKFNIKNETRNLRVFFQMYTVELTISLF